MADGQRPASDGLPTLPINPHFPLKTRQFRAAGRGKINSVKSPVDLKNIRHYKDGGIEFNPNLLPYG